MNGAPTMQARPQIDVYAMLNTLGISREQFQSFNPQERQIAAAKYIHDSQQHMMPPPVPRPPTAQGHHPDIQRPQSRMACFFSVFVFTYLPFSPGHVQWVQAIQPTSALLAGPTL
jgi:hypothetical protein